MKKYVFLTFAVSGVGGTQIYVRNKLLFLQKHGWDVTIICTEPGHDVCVKELKPYEDFVLPQMMKNPYIFSKKQRQEIIEKMKSFIGETDCEVVIETNFIQVNLWGEILAEEIGGKHFAFLIQEDYSLSDLRYMRFYDFKYQRGELAGNTEFALTKLFEGYREVPENKKGELLAVCYNTIEECESEHDSFIVDADYHIGSIGRINKPFVNPMVEDIKKFAKEHSDKTFQMVFFGGSPDKADIDAIYESVKDTDNLSVYVTGAIFPVPEHLLDKMDVFVSSAGAARTSSDAGYITIAIDAMDFDAIGIVGYTTKEIVHRNPQLPYDSTGRLLERILIDREFDALPPQVAVSSPDYMEVFETHMQYLSESADSKEYYDIKKIKPKFVNILSYRLFGENGLQNIYKILSKIKRG